MEIRDPALPGMGDEHTVISFLKAERLEFSSLRHAKFSTMLFLRFLSSETKTFPERWPRLYRQPLADAAGTAQDALVGDDSGKSETKKNNVAVDNMLSTSESKTLLSEQGQQHAIPMDVATTPA